MSVAHTRSEEVLSTDPEKLSRTPEDMRRFQSSEWSPPAEEVVRISPTPRIPPRTQREWHRIFGADA